MINEYEITLWTSGVIGRLEGEEVDLCKRLLTPDLMTFPVTT